MDGSWDIRKTAELSQQQIERDYKINLTLRECIVLTILRKNEMIPSPCSYYEEDNFLIRRLIGVSEEIVKELG